MSIPNDAVCASCGGTNLQENPVGGKQSVICLDCRHWGNYHVPDADTKEKCTYPWPCDNCSNVEQDGIKACVGCDHNNPTRESIREWQEMHDRRCDCGKTQKEEKIERESCPSCGQYADADGSIKHLHACRLGKPAPVCTECGEEIILDFPTICEQHCENYMEDCVGMPQLCSACKDKLWPDGTKCPWGPGFHSNSPSTR